nr:carboxyl-terminal-processing peptidase 3, chloroplastic [Ipomoea batatas]
METLCSKLDLGHYSMSKPLIRPTSKPYFSYGFSCFNHGRKPGSRLVVPQALDKRKSTHRLKNESPGEENENLFRWAARGVLGFAAAASVCSNFPVLAETITVAFPVSHTPEVNTVQRTLVEAWGLIRESFVDPTFNHQDWDLKLQETMVEMFPLRSEDAAYNKIRGMLSTLGDPYTRIISPKVVLSCVENSPAARAGIHEGDELIEINGEKLDGIDGEAAAQKLRGRAGTTVTVKVHSGNVSGRNDLREVKLPREVIKLSPISSAIITHRMSDGRLSKTGYVKLSTFSQTAAVEMENTVQEMENQGGGLVKAGLDIAQLWLDGDETLVNTIDRDGNMQPISMVDGHAVNEGSASASEILAGALHDNGRAVLVGHKTFGKGKIQSVTQLHDGSALFVTVAKYLSPALHDIDQVGITPDVQCTVEVLNSPKDLEADSCIMVAEHELDIVYNLVHLS